MDMRRLAVVLAVVVAVVELGCGGVWGKYAFEVEDKFKVSGKERTLSALKAHDTHRHRRHFAVVDVPLGGDGLVTSSGLYYAKVGLGTPSKDFLVQVDTGSDLLWVNCAGCVGCPLKSSLGINLTQFDPHKSKTSSLLECHPPGSKSRQRCTYNYSYGDGSTIAGYYVRDNVQLNQATENPKKTSQWKTSILFGCGTNQTATTWTDTPSVLPVDGIIGFGPGLESMLSQLGAAGEVKREFAHCLNAVKGGGIFAIGDVVSPTVKTTPLLPNAPHYVIKMKGIEVGGSFLNVSTYEYDHTGGIIDSGSTLANVPQVFYQPLMTKIMARHPGLKLDTSECFQRSHQNVQDAFPTVSFHFEGSLTLKVHPRDYLIKTNIDYCSSECPAHGVDFESEWCFGWQKGGYEYPDGKDMFLFGDMVLSNKLVVYDLQNQALGWTEYSCSSSIKVKDKKSGKVYTVGAHNLSPKEKF